MCDLLNKKLFLLDMDGTIYIDNTLFIGSLEFLDKIKNSGKRFVFLTNNSSKGIESYVDKMMNLGIKVTDKDFLTSVDCLIDQIKEYKDKKIYLVGTESFKKQLIDNGFNVTNSKDCDFLILGFDRELNYQKLEDACEILSTRNDVTYLATNPDWVCPSSFGSVPDCGSIAKMIETATGKLPRFIGKPKPDMINMAIEKAGVTKKETIIIGDRLYTDIMAGYNAGIDTCFVLSGEGKESDLKDYDFKPTYIVNSVKDLIGSI